MQRQGGLNIPLPDRCWGYLLATFIAMWTAVSLAPAAGVNKPPPPASSAPIPDLAAAMAQYRRALAEYVEAWATYDAAAEAYWKSVSEKRHLRSAKRASHQQISIDDYVLTQPPVYTGPPKPRDPSRPPEETPPAAAVPVVADFLRPRSRNSNSFPGGPKANASSNAPMPRSRWQPA